VKKKIKKIKSSSFYIFGYPLELSKESDDFE